MTDRVVDGGDASSTFTSTLDGGSASTIYGPSLQPYSDGFPCPRVVVNVTTVVPATVTGTLHRIYDDVDEVVPGADMVPSAGGFVRTDYFPPLGVPVSYRVEMFDINGASLGFTDAETTSIDVPDSTCWMSSPFNPQLSVQVELDDVASSKLQSDINAQTHNIGGRRIVISEAIYGYVGIPMSFWVESVDAAVAAENVFADGLGLSVIRVAPPMQVPRVLYAFGVPTRQEVNLPAGVEDTYFDLTVDEASAPSTSIVAAVLTYGRYTDNFATYGSFRSQYSTYRDAILNPPAEQ